MRIKLDESLLVGHDLIDQDHQDLVPFVNIFLESLRQGAGKNSVYDDADEVSIKFSAHFERENRLMTESRYPDYQNHLAEHQNLLGDLAKFLHTLEDATDESIVSTVEYIENWFLKHVASSDKKLGQFLRERAAKVGA